MPPGTFPDGMQEIEFVAAYARSALRRPQVAADAALRSLVFAELTERPVLAGLIACELGEACRRLAAVYFALGDRRYSIGRALMAPLPGVERWQEFVHQAGTFTPEQTLRELGLGEGALEHATRLRSQPELADLTPLVAAAASGNALILVRGGRAAPDSFSVAGATGEAEAVVTTFGAGEDVAARLADSTAELCAIARGFLDEYVHGRQSAGWRPE